MLTKTLVAIAMMLYSLGAHAHTPSAANPGEQAPRNPAQILERLKAASPVAPCAGIASTADFCQNVGQREYSGCGGLALAAGFTLGPPAGAAVGFYCSGNVYLATEQCKSRCRPRPWCAAGTRSRPCRCT